MSLDHLLFLCPLGSATQTAGKKLGFSEDLSNSLGICRAPKLVHFYFLTTGHDPPSHQRLRPSYPFSYAGQLPELVPLYIISMLTF